MRIIDFVSIRTKGIVQEHYKALESNVPRLFLYNENNGYRFLGSRCFFIHHPSRRIAADPDTAF